MKKPIVIWLEPPKTDFPYPFVCSLSPPLRIVANTSPRIKNLIREQCKGAVKYFEESKELCLSLKVPQPHGRIMRQFDLKTNADGPIVLKFFMSWDGYNDRWFVFVEGPNEEYWEDGQIDWELN